MFRTFQNCLCLDKLWKQRLYLNKILLTWIPILAHWFWQFLWFIVTYLKVVCNSLWQNYSYYLLVVIRINLNNSKCFMTSNKVMFINTYYFYCNGHYSFVTINIHSSMIYVQKVYTIGLMFLFLSIIIIYMSIVGTLQILSGARNTLVVRMVYFFFFFVITRRDATFKIF